MPNTNPTLHLTGSTQGQTALPTVDDLVRLYRALTGRDPSPEDLARPTSRDARAR